MRETMSLIEPPPVRPGDDLDGLLRAYFQAQMPHPWPALKLPPARSRWAAVRRRLALAASVALLLLGALLLPGQYLPRSDTDGVVPQGGSAKRERLPGKDRPQPERKGPMGDEEFDPTGFELPGMK
jgi:hypothetical protein